ncbi:2-oxo-4-hydroxy-4-carboxy-5-ureidoimidazoline decarboxylase [Streptomyces sp. NBC_01508]|uniref:2-oxo-4-hydroxy-4-carboxy-5-ureidoimidazoline decarboxylase n=1 Tax=Streptomyces sp. NBC_01508 TaxID=2903888 RepID=UPI003866CE03
MEIEEGSRANVPCPRPSREPELSRPSEIRASVGHRSPTIDSVAKHPSRPYLPTLLPPLPTAAPSPPTISPTTPVTASASYRFGHPSRDAASEEPTLSSDSPAGLTRFNTAPADTVERALLACCGNRHWARRLADHRPYPTVDALLAAADEASYDLSRTDLAGALADETPADETSADPHHAAPHAARTALRAAHAAYESSFGHAFVISLDRYRPAERLNQVLTGIRERLAHDPDEERAVAADELRLLARSRVARLVADGPPAPRLPQESNDYGRPDSPSVAV